MVLDEARLEKFSELASGDKEAIERVKSLLTASEKVAVNVKIGDFEFRVTPMIPKRVRRDMMQLSKLEDDKTVSDEQKMECSEEAGYKLLAAICLDAPLNNPETWRELDEERGLIHYILGEVMDKIYESSEDVRKFRGVR